MLDETQQPAPEPTQPQPSLEASAGQGNEPLVLLPRLNNTQRYISRHNSVMIKFNVSGAATFGH